MSEAFWVLGTRSMRMSEMSLTSSRVVMSTRIANRKVQMGSAMFQRGSSCTQVRSKEIPSSGLMWICKHGDLGSRPTYTLQIHQDAKHSVGPARKALDSSPVQESMSKGTQVRRR